MPHKQNPLLFKAEVPGGTLDGKKDQLAPEVTETEVKPKDEDEDFVSHIQWDFAALQVFLHVLALWGGFQFFTGVPKWQTTIFCESIKQL